MTDYKALYEQELQENKKLKEITEGIMNEEGTGHILGCNAYEKFCQAMCELKYDEKWITELKEELEWKKIDLQKEVKRNKKLKEQNKKLQEEFDDKEHQHHTMVAFMEDGDKWSQFDEWFKDNIDEDDKKHEWVKQWMENTEYESEEKEPQVILITDSEQCNLIRSQGCGTLMFPSKYRKIDISDINARVWKHIRYKYKLKGRWEIYSLTSLLGDPKQNKEVKWKHPHVTDAEWDGAYNGGADTLNNYVSDYVYGDVWLVKK